MSGEGCLFCKVVSGQVPSEQVATADGVVAFKDKFPQAPVHILVVPVEHIDSAHDLDLDGAHDDLLAHCFRLTQRVAEKYGIADGYRITTNIGRKGGQAIGHLHFHVLGGRQLGHIDDRG
ncbi:MAG: HIT domain-containing protein [Egibacteraceae bacterium]